MLVKKLESDQELGASNKVLHVSLSAIAMMSATELTTYTMWDIVIYVDNMKVM